MCLVLSGLVCLVKRMMPILETSNQLDVIDVNGEEAYKNLVTNLPLLQKWDIVKEIQDESLKCERLEKWNDKRFLPKLGCFVEHCISY